MNRTADRQTVTNATGHPTHTISEHMNTTHEKTSQTETHCVYTDHSPDGNARSIVTSKLWTEKRSVECLSVEASFWLFFVPVSSVSKAAATLLCIGINIRSRLSQWVLNSSLSIQNAQTTGYACHQHTLLDTIQFRQHPHHGWSSQMLKTVKIILFWWIFAIFWA